ncbi:MAG: hypothetical protein MK066_00695 [Crocinitomicaceae bacterium]|nr:hypothetical protein [Crocinitomicaceae bacterium]
MIPIKKIVRFIFVICCVLPFYGASQGVDTMVVAGSDVFVYPFKVESKRSYKYWRIMHADKNKEASYTYEEYLEAVGGRRMIPDSMLLTRQEFKRAIKLQKIRSYKRLKKNFFPKLGTMPTKEEFHRYRKRKRFKVFDKKNKEEKYLRSKKLRKAVLANPYPLLLQEVEENDLIPVLDPIPDGKYVQLYEPYCIYDENGACQMVEDCIAGYFTIKDNKLDGEATWVDLKGDTLKHGMFDKGLREGVWTFLSRELKNRLDEKGAMLYIEQGAPSIDSTLRIVEYRRGAKEGRFVKYESSIYPVSEGHYFAGEKSGEWTFRPVQVNKNEDGTFSLNEDNKQITEHYFLNTDDSLIVKPIWIRDGMVNTWSNDPEKFNFLPEYDLLRIPGSLYSIAFDQPENLDLEEEVAIREYEYLEEDLYQYNQLHSLQASVFDKVIDENIKRGKAIDSLGAIPKYIGVYEAFYPNGQLAFRYELPGGKLKEEPIIYWDNGRVYDAITFDTDSSHYERKVFDYDGKLYTTIYYDSLGDFKNQMYEEEEQDSIEIDGLMVPDYDYGDYWYYSSYDTLRSENLSEKVMLYRSWSKVDSAILWDGFYDPKTRIRDGNIYAMDGGIITYYYGEFSHDFESWTGKVHDHFGELELETTRSASLSENIEADSIPQYHVRTMYEIFDITYDYVLKRNGEPYSGDLSIDFTKKKAGIGKDMVIELPYHNGLTPERMEKEFDAFKRKGKTKLELEFSQLNSTDYTQDFGKEVFDNVFGGLTGNFFEIEKADRFTYEWDREKSKDLKVKIKKKDVEAYVVRIEGKMIDGKPEGFWRSYDQFGKIVTEVPFTNGQVNGRVKQFSYKMKAKYSEYDYMYEGDMMQDSVPEKRTYFMSNAVDFVNGKRDGKDIVYNWLGEVKSESTYKDGFRSGPSMERNRMATSKSNYEYGELDGYLKTYLTLPGKDSILVYDLNFQEGLLQGESKSYHTNGNISKKGFFLSGQPIDDYNGYDSLGFKYHYVKFKYSFPVEEKIWEENQLSVRYLFDWQDSIRFVPIDITNSESLESMLYDSGLGKGLYDPYYGRPSIVNKSGIDYQLTKYYPNDTVARDGKIEKGKKAGCWEYFSYNGEKLYEANYFDTLLIINDSIRFKSKGIYSEFDSNGEVVYESYIIEKSERYDCSHSDHYEVRQLKTIWQAEDSLNRMNGHVYNYYDNGSIQSDGLMKDGLPTGEWRFYDPNGKLNKYGVYTLGKRNGRWLSGDLSKTKYLGDICLNPNMPDIEDEIKYRENLLDIEVINYRLGKVLNRQFYDVDMNQFIEIEESVEEVEGME